MIVHIERRENPYASIDKKAIADKRLSWKARGLLVYLLSKPPAWRVRMEHLANESPDGRDALRSGMAELLAVGYAAYGMTKDGAEWTIYETPIDPKKPSAEKPHRENPDEGTAKLAKSDTSNNDSERENEKSTADAAFSLETEPTHKKSRGSVGTKTKDSSAHSRLTALWSTAFSDHFRQAYYFAGGKDGAATKKLLETGKTPEELVEIAQAAWKFPEDFYGKQAVTLHGFLSQFNQINLKFGAMKPKKLKQFYVIKDGTVYRGGQAQYALGGSDDYGQHYEE